MAGLSISQSWDETKQVISRDGSLLTTIALALMVLPGIISELATPAAPKGELPPPGAWMMVTAIAILIGLVGQLAVIHLAMGSRATVGEAIRHGAQRAPAYIGATLLWTAPFGVAIYILAQTITPEKPSPVAGLGLLILIPLFLFVVVRLILTSSVATAERGGPLEVLKRSWGLTAGNWWRLFGFIVLLMIAAAIVVITAGIVAGLVGKVIFGGVEPMSVGALVLAAITQLAGAALTVVFVVMLARMYLQLVGRGVEASAPTSGI